MSTKNDWLDMAPYWLGISNPVPASHSCKRSSINKQFIKYPSFIAASFLIFIGLHPSKLSTLCCYDTTTSATVVAIVLVIIVPRSIAQQLHQRHKNGFAECGRQQAPLYLSFGTMLLRLCQNQARRLYSTQRQQCLFPTRTIRSLLDTTQDNGNVAVRAWIRSVRKQKQVAFANINDGSSLKGMQAILTPEQAERLDSGFILTCNMLTCMYHC